MTLNDQLDFWHGCDKTKHVFVSAKDVSHRGLGDAVLDDTELKPGDRLSVVSVSRVAVIFRREPAPPTFADVVYIGTPKSADNSLEKLWQQSIVGNDKGPTGEALETKPNFPVVVGGGTQHADAAYDASAIEGGITQADVAAAISIPFDTLPENIYIKGTRHVLGEKKDKESGKIEFYAYEKSALDEAEDLRELNAKLLSDDDIKQYEGSGGRYVFPEHRPCGYTSIAVLQDLWGLPYNNLILAYILGLHPTKIHVGNWSNCDCCTDRVHVHLSEDKKTVTRITQEVRVGYGTGYDVGVAKRCLKEGKPLPEKGSSGVIGHTAGLERVDFR